jgi:hypothetical protein
VVLRKYLDYKPTRQIEVVDPDFESLHLHPEAGDTEMYFSAQILSLKGDCLVLGTIMIRKRESNQYPAGQSHNEPLSGTSFMKFCSLMVRSKNTHGKPNC